MSVTESAAPPEPVADGVLTAFAAPFVTPVNQLSTALPQAITDAQHDSAVHRLDERFHIAQHATEHLNTLPNVIVGAADTVRGGVVAVSTVFFPTLFLLQAVVGELLEERAERLEHRSPLCRSHVG